MDPDANLEEQRRIVARMLADDTASTLIEDGLRLAELSLALGEWIAKGGALPSAWVRS